MNNRGGGRGGYQTRGGRGNRHDRGGRHRDGDDRRRDRDDRRGDRGGRGRGDRGGDRGGRSHQNLGGYNNQVSNNKFVGNMTKNESFQSNKNLEKFNKNSQFQMGTLARKGALYDETKIEEKERKISMNDQPEENTNKSLQDVDDGLDPMNCRTSVDGNINVKLSADGDRVGNLNKCDLKEFEELGQTRAPKFQGKDPEEQKWQEETKEIEEEYNEYVEGMIKRQKKRADRERTESEKHKNEKLNQQEQATADEMLSNLNIVF